MIETFVGKYGTRFHLSLHLIFGIVASVKTTLARKVSKELSIPYFEGDCIAWDFPNEKRYKRSDEEQKSII